MKFIIKHEIRGRIRIHAAQSRMSAVQADTLAYYVGKLEGVTSVKVQERVQDAVICYTGDRETLILALRQFAYENVEVPEQVLASSSRALNSEYWEKLVTAVVLRAGSKMFLPYSIRSVIAAVNICGMESAHWHTASWKFRYWMEQPSVYLCSVAIWRLHLP